MVGPRHDNVYDETRWYLDLEVTQRIGKRWRCGYAHDSQLAHGHPTRDDREIVLDGAACGVRWGGDR